MQGTFRHSIEEVFYDVPRGHCMPEPIDMSNEKVLVTGGAGFIGSHLCDSLINMGAEVVVFDNLSAGKMKNIQHLMDNDKFTFIQGDIMDRVSCDNAVKECTLVSHQAAVSSVPMSIDDPLHSLTNNVLGTLNVMLAAKDAGVRRIVHASSSAVYGDDETLPKLESEIGKLLSPYAASKRIAELLQETFVNCYEIQIIGLRYFNVFGQKQDPDGAYAAVIPKFVDLLLDGKAPTIFGDGEQSRDFIFVSNIVAGNIAALTAAYKEGMNGEVFNIACSEITTINDLYYSIRDILAERNPQIAQIEPIYAEARTGDILHSFADISKARNILGFEPSINLKEGLAISIEWYLSNPQW